MNDDLIIPGEHSETVLAALAVVRGDMIEEGAESSTNPIEIEEYKALTAAIEALRKAVESKEDPPFAIEFLGSDQPNEIAAYIHCSECIKTKPSGVPPREWAQLEVGYTADGIQIWCRRHEWNIVHIKWAKAVAAHE